MFPLPQFLNFLILTTPAIIAFDGPMIQGWVVAAAAVLLAVVVLRIQPGEVVFLSSVIRTPAVFALLPAFWILIQLLPLKTIGLANPIWDSAATALGRPLHETISIDPGATLVSLARYLSIAAIVLVAAAAAVDRNNSKRVLFSLVAATTLIAMLVLTRSTGNLKLLTYGTESSTTTAATDCAGLGVILAAAAAAHILTRVRTNRTDRSAWLTRSSPIFFASLVAVAVCSLAVIVDATTQSYFAVSCGIATLLVGIVIRRFHFGPWGYWAVAALVLVFATAVFALRPDKQTMDLTLMFATRAPASLIAVTERVMAETRWTGTGAGTFADVLPIYRGIDEMTTGSIAPTAAAAIAVQMGRPFLWATLIGLIALFVSLLRSSARRGRDSYYSMAGASSIVTFTLLGFGNAELFSTPALIIVAATVGTAIGQSKGRSSL